jgi:hypothetical protein
MTWQPPSRPSWVEHINSGDIWPMTAVAQQPFTIEHIVGQAAASLGCSRHEIVDELDDATLEAMSVLLPALENEARLHVLGRWITHRFLARLLLQRVLIERTFRDTPTLASVSIDEPWVVAGAPRTGTTILHEVLMCDPALRGPLGWELLFPAPLGEGDDDPRIGLADIELRTPQTVASGIVAIHEYSARMPKECLSAMSFAFRSEEFVARYHVPSYVKWLQACDMTPAYAMHKRVLQMLQGGPSARRWVLKSPVHLHSLDELLHTYPDAKLSFTHRDPMLVLPSVTSLLANLRWAHSDHVDFTAIGAYHADLYSQSLDRLVDLDASSFLPDHRCTHSTHQEFLEDALVVISGIYSQLGIELPKSTVREMSQHLDAHPQGDRGGHTYSFDDLGLNVDREMGRFARYADRFLS